MTPYLLGKFRTTLFILSLVFIGTLSLSGQCGVITSVTFADGTPIVNGGKYLLSDLPSNLEVHIEVNGNPGLATFLVTGASGTLDFDNNAPFTSDPFSNNEGEYYLRIRLFEGSTIFSRQCYRVDFNFEVVQDLDLSFDEDASDFGINVDNGKDGGLAFGDYDNDGDLDLLVNTDDGSTRSRLYRNNGDYTFTDVTSTLAPYMLTTTRERAAVWGDLNNDGWLDYLRNTSFGGIEVYIQPTGGGVFGNGNGGTTPLIFDSGNVSDGLNSEGVGMLDFDGDGDLDIIFDNHNYGIDVLRNNYVDHSTGTVVDPPTSSLFTHATPGTNYILGLAQSAIDGDYGSFTDVNDDGWVDIFMRKQGENDFFLNQGGTFINGADLAEANNGNKGAVNLYDYDNDGDFDAFWTENGDNQIFRNDNGVWTPLGSATGIPTAHPGNSIDEVVSGDIDNDGDIDILLVGDNRSQFYLNQLNDPIDGRNTGGPMTFALSNSVIFHDGDDGEGASLIDIDNDGDLDVYINVENEENVLYINNLYTDETPEILKDYLLVKVIDDRSEYMQSGRERPALGATVVLEDCDGNVISGIRELNGGTGHGTQDPPAVHFGLVDGPDFSYRVVVKYPNWRNPATGQVERKIVSKWIRPSEETVFPVTMEFRPSDNDILCPVEICGNGIDDDFDLKTDCEDEDCEGAIDIDGDGLASWCDLDDDNDGILDTDEGFCNDYVTMVRWTHNPGDPDPGDGNGHKKAFFEPAIIRSTQNEISGSGVTDVNPGQSHVQVYNTNGTSLGEAIALNDYLEYEFTTVPNFGDRVYHFDAYGVFNAMGITGTDMRFGVLMSTDNFATYDIIEQGVPHLQANNFAFDYRSINPVFRSQLLEGTTYTFRVYFYDLTGGNVHTFDDFTLYVCSSDDIDEDGIANFEDPDSDGDLCLDALEGADPFDDSDLDGEALAGNVDSDGVPVIAEGGQGVGESQDETAYGTCGSFSNTCSDGVQLIKVGHETASGLGAQGLATLSNFYIPDANNRVVFVVASYEREHCQSGDNCSDTNTSGVGLGDNFADGDFASSTQIQMNGQFTGPGGSVNVINPLVLPAGDLRFATQYAYNTPPDPNVAATQYSRSMCFFALYESDLATILGGSSTGNISVQITDATTPLDEGDGALISAYVFSNVGQSVIGVVRSGVNTGVNAANGGAAPLAGDYTIPVSNIDNGQEPDEDIDGFLIVGMNGVQGYGFETLSGYQDIHQTTLTNNNGEFGEKNESDGFTLHSQFRNGPSSGIINSFTLQSAAPSSLSVNGGMVAAFTFESCDDYCPTALTNPHVMYFKRN